MKKIIIALNIIILGGVSAYAQKMQDPDFDGKKGPAVPEQSANNKKSSKSKNKTARNNQPAGDVLVESGTNLEARLLSTLDVKKTEVGDEVVLKLTKSVEQNGEVVVPKGTKLIGRVTEVQQRTKGEATSKISLVFEELQNKDLTAPLNASIVSVTNVAGRARANNDLFAAEGTGNAGSTTTASRRGSGGGGLLGGVGNTVGGVVNTTTGVVGGVTDTVGSTAGTATGAVGRTVDGIRISQSASATASGSSTLSVENENLRLQKGTTFRLQLNESIQN